MPDDTTPDDVIILSDQAGDREYAATAEN